MDIIDKIRAHVVDPALRRARERALEAEQRAKANPFSGGLVHAAVHAHGFVEGYEAAMSDILGVLAATESE